MLSWQLYTQLFREMENENAAEYVCIDYDNKVVSDDNDFEPETHCKNLIFEFRKKSAMWFLIKN